MGTGEAFQPDVGDFIAIIDGTYLRCCFVRPFIFPINPVSIFFCSILLPSMNELKKFAFHLLKYLFFCFCLAFCKNLVFILF